MEFSLAPMEGVTGFVIRGALFHNFTHIDKFYTPFIPAASRMNSKILRDISPEKNQGMLLIPQLMSNNADEVINMHDQLAEFGYNEVNINLGCPSGTVTSKKRGSGLLAYPDELERFLDQLYSKANFPVSIKTRIGYDCVSEWDRLLSIYSKYPMSEFIIHPRIRKDIYKNHPRMEEFAKALPVFEERKIPLVFNGDIVDLESYETMTKRFPSINHTMIGRGLMANPALCQELATGFCPDKKERIRSFHDEILEEYQVIMGETDVMKHMKQLWTWLIESFADSDKLCKKIKKSQSLAEYKIYVDQLFASCEIL